MVLESRPDAGYEFFGALRSLYGKEAEPKSALARALREKFARRDSLRACAPLFYACLRDQRVLLSTRVLACERLAEGFAVTICNASGESRIFARHLVDTRAEDRYIAEKRLNLLFLSGRMASLPMPADADMTEARRRLADALHALAGEDRVAAVADEFDVVLTDFRTLEYDGIVRLPSAGYADPISAFDAGVLLGEELFGR